MLPFIRDSASVFWKRMQHPPHLKGGICLGEDFDIGLLHHVYFPWFIILRIAMGCGVVCGAQSPSMNPYCKYSHARLTELCRRVRRCEPLLAEGEIRRFAAMLDGWDRAVLLKARQAAVEEEVEPELLFKWRLIIYGLDKDDQGYSSSLGIQVPLETKALTEVENNQACPRQIQLAPAIPLWHACFPQIEKDLDRTFEWGQDSRGRFERVLKRIANFFPSMGYTQGVNFVVGYLLVAGYSEEDAFWLFSHLALHPRFLVLGLYEDGFPLARVLAAIFQGMLRRLDPGLHRHLYSFLALDDSSWVFKWFITFYVYSFPLPIVRLVWNTVTQLGAIGLVYFALALVMQLRSQLLEQQDPCDSTQFFQQLKSISHFNALINSSALLQKAYELEMLDEDTKTLVELPSSIYKEYYLHFCLASKGVLGPYKDPMTLELRGKLYDWYQEIILDRERFVDCAKGEVELSAHIEQLPETLRSEYLDLQRSIHDLEERVIQNQSLKLSTPVRHSKATLPADGFDEILPADIHIQEERSKVNPRISYDMEEEIGEVEQESQSDNSSKLESMEVVQPEPMAKGEGQGGIKINTLVGNASRQEKAGHMELYIARRGLAIAGQNILCDLSITNSQYSSSSSKNSTFRPRKQKENKLYPSAKGKVRTEEVSQPSIGPSSQRESLPDNHSLSGLSHGPQLKEKRASVEIIGHSQLQFMVNSGGPAMAGQALGELGSEIELFNGAGLFKKKQRIQNRNSNVLSINQNLKSTPKLDDPVRYTARQPNPPFPHTDSVDALTSLTRRKHSTVQTMEG